MRNLFRLEPIFGFWLLVAELPLFPVKFGRCHSPLIPEHLKRQAPGENGAET